MCSLSRVRSNASTTENVSHRTDERSHRTNFMRSAAILGGAIYKEPAFLDWFLIANFSKTCRRCDRFSGKRVRAWVKAVAFGGKF
jgi:hypothetical protein